MDRVRKVNVESLSYEDAEQLGVEIGRKLAEIAQEAAEKANRMLKIYGLETKMGFEQPYPISRGE